MQAASQLKTLAICLDDFGLHRGVNEAALELAQAGRITAISCMVGAPEWTSGAARMAELPAGRVDIGLHLDFTEHTFGADVRHSLSALIAQSEARLLDRQRVRAEIVNQLDAFEQAMHRAPDHVDGHQHVHQFPVIRDELVAALVQRYPHQRPWLRRTRRPGGLHGLKPWLIEWLGCGAMEDLAREHGFAQNESLLGVYDFEGDAGGYARLLARWLDLARHGDLLMCHASSSSPAQDPIGAARLNEWQVLAGGDLDELIARHGVTLAPLSAVVGRA